LQFVAELRELSGGKPVGFKLCVGQPIEFFSILKAMRETGICPDFITVDGAEGGTGAAPVEFADSVGMPLADGLNFVHNALIGAGLREQLRLISAGKIATGFHLLKHLALGADLCNSARGMMFALGCIQALKCNTNECPVGVATQRPALVRGLVVPDKADRIASFHEKTIASVLDLCGVAGLSTPEALRPSHLFRRVSPSEVSSLDRIYPQIAPGSLRDGNADEHFQKEWDRASFERFGA
jgi:glutamate synthase domain-containing protein 2